MANHHGSTPLEEKTELDEDIKAEHQKRFQETMLRGGGKKISDGRLTPTDEGAIRFLVGEKDGQVIIDFRKPVLWLGMPPAQAVRFAEIIIAKARAVARKSGETLTVDLSSG